MGYPYSAHAVDLKALAAIAGSKDARLEAALTKKYGKHYAENAEWFKDEIADGAPTLSTAVSEIIADKVPKRSKHGFQYGYALEVLVMHIGKRIDEDELGLGCEDAIDGYLKKAKQPSTDKLTKHGVFPFRIPAPADFPGIGTMTAKDMTAFVAALDAAAPLMEDDEGALEVAGAFRSWCKKVMAKKQSMVWLYY